MLHISQNSCNLALTELSNTVADTRGIIKIFMELQTLEISSFWFNNCARESYLLQHRIGFQQIEINSLGAKHD